MDDSKPIWRVNKTPRFTTLGLGEYMAAEDGPRETILRDMKYERLAPSLLYAHLSHGVASYLTSPDRDARILARCRQAIESERAAATNPKRLDNLTYELRALDAFESSLNALGMRDVIFERVPGRGRRLSVGGVTVSSYPTARVRVSRPRGRDLIGALIVDTAKGQNPKTTEAKGRQVNGMKHSAAILVKAVTEDVAESGEDARVSPEHCIVFHSYRQERISAPTNSRAMMKNVEAVCRNIARGWDRIDPPVAFDPNRARYRN